MTSRPALTRSARLRRWPAAMLGAAAGLILAGCGVASHRASHTVSYGSFESIDEPVGTLTTGGDRTSSVYDAALEIGDVTNLDVSTRNGKINVLVDPTVESMVVTATFQAKAFDAAAADARVRAASIDVDELGGGRVRLAADMPGGWQNGDGASFDVRLPGPAALTVRTSNGRVTAEGPVGPLDIQTSNGRVTLDGTLGVAKIRTSNGRVDVRDHLGPLNAQSSNGALDVRLHDDASDPVNIRTSNGRVHLIVGEAFGGELTATTSNGSMSVDGFAGRLDDVTIERRRVHLVMPGEGASTVQTSNGAVKLERRASGTMSSAGAIKQ